MKRRSSIGAAVALMIVAAAPLAFAQTTSKPKKKGAKPAASASDSAADTPTPDPAPASSSPASSAGADEDGQAAQKELPATPPEPVSANTDTREDPLETYYFVGLRYRGNVIPQFLVNAFVKGGATFYSNTVGAELDIRKDGHSTMPWIALANYGFGNTLFESDSTVNGVTTGPENPGNWTVVNSSLNVLYLGLDELWSVPLDTRHHWDFEYGFGVGLGVVFGSLGNNWVTPVTGTQISPGNYAECQTTTQGAGCAPTDHNNASVNKVGGYQEKAGLLGPKPILFPYVAVPQLGIRYKPIKQIESRFNVGFSLTGFWFGLSVDYGLEKTHEPPANNTGSALRRHDML